VIASERGEHVVDPAARPADAPAWFTGARLNWAENMLRRRDGARALVELVELHAGLPAPAPRTLSFAELHALVGDLVSALLGAGLRPGDRVASYASNCIVSASPPRRQATDSRTGKRRGVSRGDGDRCVRR
jgi:acetoacetyl-CoA synthetase